MKTLHSPSIIIMSRAPKPGATKTRLTPPLSPIQACQVHRYILKHIAALISTLPSQHFLFYAGGAVTDFEGLVDSSFVFEEQQGNTLGERMSLAFQHVLQTPTDKVLMIGSDIPLLTEAHFNEAFTALDNSDVVLGPNDDGGYYLIGLKTFHSQLFASNEWGTESVLDRTLAVAKKNNLKVHLLAEEIDIDTMADIDNLIVSKYLMQMAKSNKKYSEMLDFFRNVTSV